MPQSHGARAQFHRYYVPLPVLHRHIGDALYGVAAIVGQMNVVGEVNLASVLSYSVIHFIVLITHKPLVVAAVIRKHFASERAERHRIDVTAFTVRSELRVADSELRAQHFCNRVAHKPVRLGFGDSAHVVGVGIVEVIHAF